MDKNKPVYVYAEDCTDFETTGLVGDLMPIKATFREDKNGISEVEIRMPYDQLEKWKQCQIGRILQCEVPVRVQPVISDDEFAGSVDVFST